MLIILLGLLNSLWIFRNWYLDSFVISSVQIQLRICLCFVGIIVLFDNVSYRVVVDTELVGNLSVAHVKNLATVDNVGPDTVSNFHIIQVSRPIFLADLILLILLLWFIARIHHIFQIFIFQRFNVLVLAGFSLNVHIGFCSGLWIEWDGERVLSLQLGVVWLEIKLFHTINEMFFNYNLVKFNIIND